jgi:hypothetical protein
MDRSVHFKRLVLGLPHSAPDYTSVAFTAKLAEMLGLDIVGLFVEDESLTKLAALSCVRELRSLGGGWQHIDAVQLAQGTGQAAVEARRFFEETAKALHVGARFNLAKGAMADIIGSQSTVDDIIAIIEPKNPAERVTHQYRQLMDVAFNAPAACLLVPSRISRQKGPIVAIATSEHDSSIQAALRLAETSHEKLLVLAPPDADVDLLARLAATTNVPIDRRTIQRVDFGVPELSSLLTMTRERFVVLSRGADARFPSRLAAERAVPVLVTEPAQKKS